MTITTRKKEWLSLCAQSKIKQLLKEMLQALNVESEQYTVLIALSQRYNAVKNKKMLGEISVPEEEVAMNKIGAALTGFIQEIEAEDLEESDIKPTKLIANPILVLTTNKTEQKYLAAFFKETDFAKVEVHLMDNPPAILGYDLIIFDNRDLAECPKDFLLANLKAAEQALILERIAFMDALKAKTT